MKLVMDLVVNHTSDAHAWFAESRSSRTTPSATGTGGARPRRVRARGTGRRADQLGLGVLRPGVDLRRAHRRVLPAPVRPEQPDLNWENPEVRAGGLRDDALVARPRRRRLPDGRHQPDLQGPRRRGPGSRTADRRRATRAGRCRRHRGSPTRRRYVLNGPRVHEFLQEMHREVFAGRPPGLLNVGETPGRSVEEAGSTPTRRAASWTWSSSSSTSTSTPARRGSGTSCR